MMYLNHFCGTAIELAETKGNVVRSLKFECKKEVVMNKQQVQKPIGRTKTQSNHPASYSHIISLL